MKYKCNLIQDLLPLYYDGVCSEESKEIIEDHISQCSNCKEYYHSLCKANEVNIVPQNSDFESQKAASFRAVRKKLKREQLLLVAFVLALLFSVAFACKTFLKHQSHVLECDETISVSMIDGNLLVRLKGNQATYIRQKRVEAVINEEEKTCLFFYLSGTTWDELSTSNEVFSEYVLCASDKGAEEIDAVYYFDGDYTGIENLDGNQLQQIVDISVLLWSK